MEFVRKRSLFQNIITLLVLIIDIYVLGQFDLFKPLYLAVIFMSMNCLWFYKYFKLK